MKNLSVKIVTGTIVSLGLVYAASAATIQVDISSAFNADIIVNGPSSGPLDATQNSYNGSPSDGNLITQSAAALLNPALAPDNLPDDGVFAATADHPLIELAYDNSDDGFNAWNSGGGNGQADLAMPAPPTNEFYKTIHLIMFGVGGADPVIRLLYDSGPADEFALNNIPDGSSGFPGNGADFLLIGGLDRASNDGTTFNSRGVGLFGYSFTPDPNRTLVEVEVDKDGGGFVSVLGLVGETAVIPEPGSLALLGLGGLLLAKRSRG